MTDTTRRAEWVAGIYRCGCRLQAPSQADADELARRPCGVCHLLAEQTRLDQQAALRPPVTYVQTLGTPDEEG